MEVSPLDQPSEQSLNLGGLSSFMKMANQIVLMGNISSSYPTVGSTCRSEPTKRLMAGSHTTKHRSEIPALQGHSCRQITSKHTRLSANVLTVYLQDTSC